MVAILYFRKLLILVIYPIEHIVVVEKNFLVEQGPESQKREHILP